MFNFLILMCFEMILKYYIVNKVQVYILMCIIHQETRFKALYSGYIHKVSDKCSVFAIPKLFSC